VLAAWVRFSGMLMVPLSALDTQMRGDAKLSFFGYAVLAGLSQAPERTLTMSRVAVLANGSLSRASHAVSALERQGWVTRHPAPARHVGDAHRCWLREGSGQRPSSCGNGPPTGNRPADEPAVEPIGTHIGNHSRPTHPDRRAASVAGPDVNQAVGNVLPELLR
jgi:hypothetical protein